MKSLSFSVVVAAGLVSFASLSQAQQVQASSTQPLAYSSSLTREQVRQGIDEARREGRLSPGAEYTGLVGPFAKRFTGVQESRQEVVADLNQARAEGRLAPDFTEQGLVGPQAAKDAVKTDAAPLSREEVKHQLAVARAQGLMAPGLTETGLVGPKAPAARSAAATGLARF